MKKMIAVCAVLLSFGALAADSFLYWMVGTDVTVDKNSFKDYAYAAVGVRDANGNHVGYLTLSDGADWGAQKPGTKSPFYANLGDYSYTGDWSFYIELFNAAEKSVGYSENLSYSAALADYVTSNDILNTPLTSPWTVSTFNTPEPSSALLLLLGCAGLALKRKKQAKA